jgi:hypothetical protein
MFSPTSTRRASSIIKAELVKRGLPFSRVHARTVDLTDLARAHAVFVIVEGWEPNPQAVEIKNLARAHGFHVEFKGNGIIG